MTQNIYDQADFFQQYSQLDRSIDGLSGAPEWPVLRTMLPDLRGRRVLDLGCGFGWFCRWAVEHGASQIDGIDVSSNMLDRARATTRHKIITYTQADLEDVDLKTKTYDVVYSSLVLHYLRRLDRLVAQVHAALMPGGQFVFSVEHPIHTAPSRPEWVNASDGKIWPLNRYLHEGARTTDWLVPGVIKQHRTIATYVNLLLQAGFHIRRIEEWGPSSEQIAQRPEWQKERDRPPFLLVHVQR